MGCFFPFGSRIGKDIERDPVTMPVREGVIRAQFLVVRQIVPADGKARFAVGNEIILEIGLCAGDRFPIAERKDFHRVHLRLFGLGFDVSDDGQFPFVGADVRRFVCVSVRVDQLHRDVGLVRGAVPSPVVAFFQLDREGEIIAVIAHLFTGIQSGPVHMVPRHGFGGAVGGHKGRGVGKALPLLREPERNADLVINVNDRGHRSRQRKDEQKCERQRKNAFFHDCPPYTTRIRPYS